MTLNSKWKVYPDPTFENHSRHFFIGQRVMWFGRDKRTGVIEEIVFAKRSASIKHYLVRVANRRHGGQRVVRLRPGRFEHASIVDEIGAL